MKQSETAAPTRDYRIRIDSEGFLCDRNDWSEGFARFAAVQDGIDLTDTHMGLIHYFREYFEQNQTHPSMRDLLEQLGTQVGDSPAARDHYQDYLYELFSGPLNPIAELCKLAGLPKPLEDVY